MNRGSFFAESQREDSQKSKETYKAFEDICKYFSKEEWAKLGNSQKRTYVYMKRNYDTMTRLGLNTTLPSFMRPKNRTTQSLENDSDEDQNSEHQDEGPQEATNVQQREHLKVSPTSEGPQSLSSSIDVNMEIPMGQTMKENDMKPLPVTAGSEPAQKELCPLGKASACSQESKKMPGPRKVKTNVWAHRLRERKNPVVYEEISDPEEDD